MWYSFRIILLHILHRYYYEKSFKKEDEKSTDISSTSTLEGDEEEKVKNGKGTKILALNKVFTRLSVLLKQDKYYIFFISVVKSLKQLITYGSVRIWQEFSYNNRPKTIHFDLPIEGNNSLNLEIKFIIKDKKF